MRLGSGFAAGMAQGQSLASNAIRLYKEAKLEADLKEVGEAQGEESTGFTAQQGKELEGLAAKGYKIDFDQGTNAYVARNDAGDTKAVAAGGVTDFMGRRTAGGVEAARASAYADVMSKYDPAKGFQLRRDLARDAREDARYVREQKQWAREDSIEDIEAKAGAALKASMVDKDGNPVAATPDLYLANIQQRAGMLAQAGHAKQSQEAMTQFYGLADVKIRHDAKQREQDALPAMTAFQSGNTQPLVDYYNKYVPGSTKISAIERGPDGGYVIQAVGADGRPLPSRTVDERGMLAMAQSLNDPKALLQHAWNEANYSLRLRGEARADNADRRADRADARAAAADGRAATTHAQTQGERKETRSVLEALYREKNPNATPAEIAAAGLGKITVPGTGSVSREERMRFTSLLGETSRRLTEARKTLTTLQQDWQYKNAKPCTPQYEELQGLRENVAALSQERSTYQSLLAGSQEAGKGAAAKQGAPAPKGGALQTLPEGAKQIGTSGGRPVYELPDGRRVVGQAAR